MCIYVGDEPSPFNREGYVATTYDDMPIGRNEVANRDLIASMRNNLDTLLALAELAEQARTIAFYSTLDPDDEDAEDINAQWREWKARFDALAASVKGTETEKTE